MRILYIADNRNRYNWGCRATSAALSELTGVDNQIVGRISGRLTLSEEFLYIPLMGEGFNRLIYKNASVEKLAKHIIGRCPEALKEKCDFLTEDFDRSIELIQKYARSNRIYREINLDAYRYDAVVINGEGTMIMSSPCRRDSLYYLLFIYWAKKRKKKVFFVNAMFSDCPVTGRNEDTIRLAKKVLSKCNEVIVRDPVSYRYAREVIGLSKCRFVPDALFSWKKYYQKEFRIRNIREILPFGYESDEELACADMVSHEYICISGGSAAAWNQSKAAEAYIRMVEKIKEKLSCPIYLLQACDGDVFLKNVAEQTHTIFVPVQIPVISGLNLLAHAGLFISGRYHPGIMAALGGTPCIFLGANSHKNLSLQEMLGYDTHKEYHACPTEKDVEEIGREAVQLMKDVRLRGKIEEVASRLAVEARQVMKYIR